jgi:tetratricopeptide (TPR) repeat protein
LPDQEDVGVDPNELMRYAAIELFVDRAQAVKPDFVLNPKNINPILAICARLDGLPLAIELVATRINAFPLQMLLEQISGRFLLHAEGLRDVPDRQRTLYHAIDWSYALLSTDQRLLFARLSIFNSGWTLDAAEEIMNDHPGFSTIESLKVLVDNNLAIQLENHGESRFGMLETIREYAAERLAQAGEIERARQNHADYYLALAEKADPFLRTASQKVWLERLDVERGNFRAALTWFVDIRGELEKGLRLAGALGWFWNIRSYVSEGRHWLDKVLLKGKCIQPAIYAKALNVAGSLAWEQSDLARARTYFQESIGLFRDLGPEHAWDLAMALGGYGNVVMYLDDQEALQRAAEESYGLFNQLDDQWGKGLSLCLIGEAHLLKHDYERAYSCFEGATSQLRKTGDRWATGVALMDWGYTNSIQGNLDLARKQLEESIALHREIGERFIQSLSINILAQVEQQQGNNQRAMALYSESLDLLRKMGIEARIADVQYNLAYFVQAHGHYQLASKLYQECLDIYSGQANEEGIAKSKAGLAAITALQT